MNKANLQVKVPEPDPEASSSDANQIILQGP